MKKTLSCKLGWHRSIFWDTYMPAQYQHLLDNNEEIGMALLLYGMTRRVCNNCGKVLDDSV